MTQREAESSPSLPYATPSLAAIEHGAAAIAGEAGSALKVYYERPLDVRFKSRQNADPVTQADEEIEALVRLAVKERFPGHGVLGEEAADTDAESEFLWVVDPLDGTANFANRLPIYAVSIGVLQRGVPVAGALFTTFGPAGQPCVLHAHRGGELHLNGVAYGAPARTLATRARLSGVPARFHYRFLFPRRPGSPPGETRSLGSIAVELGLAATGKLQYALFGSPRIWDVAAGVVLVEAAGGVAYEHAAYGWRRLERFEAPPGKPLRQWRRAVIAGDAALVARLAGRSHVRRTPAEWLERLLGYERAARVQRVYHRGRRFAGTMRRVTLSLKRWRAQQKR